MSKWLTLNELIRAEEEINVRSEQPRDTSVAYERKDALLLWTGISQSADAFEPRVRAEIY